MADFWVPDDIESCNFQNLLFLSSPIECVAFERLELLKTEIHGVIFFVVHLSFFRILTFGVTLVPMVREKGRSLISAYWSLAITTNTPGFKMLSTALSTSHHRCLKLPNKHEQNYKKNDTLNTLSILIFKLLGVLWMEEETIWL